MSLGPTLNLRLYPELRLFDTPAERRQAMRRAYKALAPTWEYVLFAFAVGAPTAAMSVTLDALATPKWLRSLACALIGGTVTAVGCIWLFRRRIQRSLRQQLVERGVPVCPKCGYQLRGLMNPRCPECGEAFDERLLELCRPDDAPPSTGPAE